MAGSSEDQPPIRERKPPQKAVRRRPALPKLTRNEIIPSKNSHEVLTGCARVLASLFERLQVTTPQRSESPRQTVQLQLASPESFSSDPAKPGSVGYHPAD